MPVSVPMSVPMSIPMSIPMSVSCVCVFSLGKIDQEGNQKCSFYFA